MAEKEEVGEGGWISLTGGLSDKKEYLYTTINGLGVLAISTLKLHDQNGANSSDLISAAALAVQTGSFHDPVEVQGLSHYLEHMIFMGSEKYQGENEYDSFITSHGGSCNAFTEYEHTVYTFEIPQQHFFQAVDIFANCFISPLLSSDSSDRELKAIESEFQLALTDDDARAENLLCHLAHSNHFLSKFSWGNLESLKKSPLSHGVDINLSLRQYFDQYYFPNNSQLVVMAPYPLQTIIEEITRSFSQWKKCISLSPPLPLQLHKDDVTASLLSSPFPSTPYLLRIIPIEKRTHSLKIVWTLPSTISDHQSRCGEYLGHLLGHEGQGSILNSLKALDLAHEIRAGIGSSGFDSNSYFSLFTIIIELTPRGVILWTQVVKIVYQFIALLSCQEPQKWIFSEIQQLAQIQYGPSPVLSLNSPPSHTLCLLSLLILCHRF
jgi:nardilysin